MDIILNKNSKELITRYKNYSKQLKNIKDEHERNNLLGYCASLRAMINYMKIIPIHESFSVIKNANSYNNYATDCSLEILNDFLEKKEYHKDLLNEILPNMQDEIDVLPVEYNYEYSKMDKKEFMNILNSFAKQFQIDNLLNKMIVNKQIYQKKSTKKSQFRAFTLYDSLAEEAEIMLDKFNYDLNDQRVIFHELGHVLDFSKINPTKINDYILKSLYLEVLSNTIERLFLRYSSKHNQNKEENKKIYSNFLSRNYEYIAESLIISFFDNEFIKHSNEITLSPRQIMDLINLDDIYDEKIVEQFIKSIGNLDLRESLIYSYGDIISLTLADEIEKNGLNCEMNEDLNKIKLNKFDLSFMKKYDITPKTYINRLHNELDNFTK